MERQPDPTPNTNTPIYELVITDIRARAESGKASYGTYLQAFNGRDALRDAYDEAIDLAKYLRQAIEERTSGQERIDSQRPLMWLKGWDAAVDSIRATVAEYPDGGGDVQIMAWIDHLIAKAGKNDCEHEWKPYNRRYVRCKKCNRFDPPVNTIGPPRKAETK